jgi:ATP-binding cassette subfamily B protein
VILLDGTTATLDPENELFVQRTINDLVQDKTVIVITYGLNSIRQADKIAIIDQGYVTEEETYYNMLISNRI